MDTVEQALRAFHEQVENCVVCREQQLLYREHGEWAKPILPADATCRSGLLFIAEAPNWRDTYKIGHRTCKLETDESGKGLCVLLQSIGLTPADVYFTNSVLCLPAKNSEKKYEVTEQQRHNCAKWLNLAIEASHARFVVTLGEKALQAVIALYGKRLEICQKDKNPKLKNWFGLPTMGITWGLLPLWDPGYYGQLRRDQTHQLEDIRPLRAVVQ